MPTACHNCGFELTTETECPQCGARTAEVEAPSLDADSLAVHRSDQLDQLRVMVRAQAAEIQALSERLDALEGKSRAAPPVQAPTLELRSTAVSQPPAESSETQDAPRPTADTPGTETKPNEVYGFVRNREQYRARAPIQAADSTAPSSRLTPSTGPSAEVSADDAWEWLVGGNWLARVGIVALVLGVAFFISLAIDRGWLGETERVILGALLGLSLLAASEYYRTRYGIWAQTVGGGGLAILYLAVWGGFALYELYPPLVAFSMFILITTGGVAQALRHDSVGLAVFATLGGFATPLLLQERLPEEWTLLAYVLLLDMGVIALAAFRNWRWFTLLAWVGSLILFGFWYTELDPSIGLAQGGISAVFIIFTAATVLFHIIRRQPTADLDLLFLTLNAVGYLLISYEVMFDDYRAWMGGFTALLAGFYALMLLACRLRTDTPLLLSPLAAALGVGFAALAVPVQFDGAWVTVAWGLEALALVWLSFRIQMRELRWFGVLLFIVSGGWLLVFDTPDAFRADLTLLLNMPMLAYASAVVLPALTVWLLRRHREEMEAIELLAVPALAVGAALYATLAIPVQLHGVWLSVAWGIEALALLWLSFRLDIKQLRWFGYLVFAVSAVWLLAVDTPDVISQDLTPFLNLPMLGYAASFVLPALAAWLLHRNVRELRPQEEVVVQVFPVWAALFAAITIPAQVGGVWVSVAWAGQAVILLTLSARLRLDVLRWFTYLLLGTMIVRLAAIDTGNVDLETFLPIVNWRFLPFFTGVASLYAAQWFARRTGVDFNHPKANDEVRYAAPILFALATLTTLWILSAEVLASADSALFDLSYSASENVSILGLTLLWGIYGAALMLAGVLRRWRWVRVTGLALLIVAVVKLFAYDSQELEQVYRVIAFLALGAILLAGGLLYQRHRHVVRGFLLDD
ncbi:MAG: DUF2339 domain-containing protein [Chloroflexi bacterium]|nr:DUF2339 domain-containing protein [Chloroflexota bacterium]